MKDCAFEFLTDEEYSCDNEEVENLFEREVGLFSQKLKIDVSKECNDNEDDSDSSCSIEKMNDTYTDYCYFQVQESRSAPCE